MWQTQASALVLKVWFRYFDEEITIFWNDVGNMLFLFQYDSMKPDVFTETAFRAFLTNLCPRPEIYEIFTC